MSSKRTDVKCPQCGSPLEIDPACVVEELYYPRGGDASFPLRHARPSLTVRVLPAALCTGCEFCTVIQTARES